LTDTDGLTNLVAQLLSAGVATRGCRQSSGRAASIRIHGRGPLSELLVETLRCSGARIAHSSQPHAAVSATDVDLVVLADYLVADPRMVPDLHSQGVAHLLVRVCDGIGRVGPLVIPGISTAIQVRRLNPALAAETHNGDPRRSARFVLKVCSRRAHGGRRRPGYDKLLPLAVLQAREQHETTRAKTHESVAQESQPGSNRFLASSDSGSGGAGGAVLTMVLCIFLFFCYWIPTIVAAVRHVPNMGSPGTPDRTSFVFLT
jgi:hypothetical protein